MVLDGSALATLGTLTCFLVKLAWSMPSGRVGLGCRKSLTLNRAHVYQLGAFHILDFAEYLDQPFHVMTVIQAKVADIQTLEDILLTREQGLQCIAETHDQALAVIVDDVMATQELICLVAQFIIAVRRVQVIHVGAQGTHVGINGHVVVVEYDDQIIGIGRGIIDAFKGQSSADACITDYGYHLTVFIIL